MTYLPPQKNPIGKTVVQSAQNKTIWPVKSKSVAIKTQEKTPAQLELDRVIAEQLTDRRFAPVKHEELTKSVTYVTAANGLFKVTKTPIGLFKEKLEEFKTPVVGLPEMESGVDLAIPKLPMKHLIQALSFYRDINTKDKTEASTLYFWNTEDKPLPNLPGLSSEGRLVIYCPIQVNSAALSDFSKDDNVHWLRQNMSLLFELHSHNTMNAFFSGTDDANENMTQFYGVWGKVTDDEPMFAFRYVAGNSKVECSPDMLFDWPSIDQKKEVKVKETITLHGDLSLIDLEIDNPVMEKELDSEIEETNGTLIKGPFKMIDYPEDWMNQHSKPVYTPSTTYFGARQKSYGQAKSIDLFDDYGYESSYEDFYGNRYGSWEDEIPYDKKKQRTAAETLKENGISIEKEGLTAEPVGVYSDVRMDLSSNTKETFTEAIKEFVDCGVDISDFEI